MLYSARFTMVEWFSLISKWLFDDGKEVFGNGMIPLEKEKKETNTSVRLFK